MRDKPFYDADFATRILAVSEPDWANNSKTTNIILYQSVLISSYWLSESEVCSCNTYPYIHT
jgi:hypothetical protein